MPRVAGEVPGYSRETQSEPSSVFWSGLWEETNTGSSEKAAQVPGP